MVVVLQRSEEGRSKFPLFTSDVHFSIERGCWLASEAVDNDVRQLISPGPVVVEPMPRKEIPSRRRCDVVEVIEGLDDVVFYPD